MKTDKQIWFEIGRGINAEKKKKAAIKNEQEHIQQDKESNKQINPAIAPGLRDALNAAREKNNKRGGNEKG